MLLSGRKHSTLRLGRRPIARACLFSRLFLNMDK